MRIADDVKAIKAGMDRLLHGDPDCPSQREVSRGDGVALVSLPHPTWYQDREIRFGCDMMRPNGIPKGDPWRVCWRTGSGPWQYFDLPVPLPSDFEAIDCHAEGLVIFLVRFWDNDRENGTPIRSDALFRMVRDDDPMQFTFHMLRSSW